MTLTIPLWLVILVVLFAPFVAAWVASLFHQGGGYLSFDLWTPFVFCVSAAACWVGVIVWLVMR